MLAQARLSHEQWLAVADALATATPVEFGRLLAAVRRSADADVGLRAIAAIQKSPALKTQRVETLKPILDKFGPPVAQAAEALYARLNAGAAEQNARLDTLLASLDEGDARRGQQVFNNRKAACAACHAIGYLGGAIGPDLTKVGKIRTERDLLEAIVFPSASFVRSYEPTQVVTTEGLTISGLVRKDAPEELILVTGPDQQVRIPREQIEELRPGTVSIMPAGLDQQLSPQELSDLVRFLKACQ